MINTEYLQLPKPEGVRGTGRTTDGVMSAIQLMDLHGGVFYMVERMVESNHIFRIVQDFGSLWNLRITRRNRTCLLIGDKFFKVVCLGNYEHQTRGQRYPVVIDHWAQFVGECVHCREITGSTLNRVCNRCGYLHNPDTNDFEVDVETQMIYRQKSILQKEDCFDWKEDGF